MKDDPDSANPETTLTPIHSLPTMAGTMGAEEAAANLDDLPTADPMAHPTPGVLPDPFALEPAEPTSIYATTVGLRGLDSTGGPSPEATTGAPAPTPTKPPLGRAGEIIGGVALQARMSASTDAEVWSAAAPDGALRRAVKLARPTEQTQTLLWDEGRTAMALDHPNIVKTHDFGLEGGRFFIVMDLVEGPSVLELVNAAYRQRKRIPEALARFVGREVLNALVHGNEAARLDGQRMGLIHRDVSPQNILLDAQGGVRLADFGAARSYAQLHVTKEQALIGKPGYMAPEQCLGETVDHRTDQFSLAVVVWEMLAMQPLFHSEDGVFETLARTLDHVPSALDTADPLLSGTLEKALEKDPDRRFRSLREFQARLWPFPSGEANSTRRALAQFLVDLRLVAPRFDEPPASSPPPVGASPVPNAATVRRAPATRVYARDDRARPAALKLASTRRMAPSEPAEPTDWIPEQPTPPPGLLRLLVLGLGVGLGLGLAATLVALVVR